jgi:hypothetical protein
LPASPSTGERHSNDNENLDNSLTLHHMEILTTFMKFLFSLFLAILGTHSCRANQDLKSLDDEELKDFVLVSETSAFKESPLWGVASGHR